jgi:hypothetical protein
MARCVLKAHSVNEIKHHISVCSVIEWNTPLRSRLLFYLIVFINSKINFYTLCANKPPVLMMVHASIESIDFNKRVSEKRHRAWQMLLLFAQGGFRVFMTYYCSSATVNLYTTAHFRAKPLLMQPNDHLKATYQILQSKPVNQQPFSGPHARSHKPN